MIRRAKQKLNYLFLLICMLFVYHTTKGQIVLQQTIVGGPPTWNGNFFSEDDLYPIDNYHKTEIKNNSYIISIYNTDLSVNSSLTYNFIPPTGYKVGRVLLTKKIFNRDDNYEFLVTYVRTDNTYDNTREKLLLYGQDGSMIKDFGTYYYINALLSNLHIIDNNFRLFVIKDSPESTQTDVYSIQGVLPSGIGSLKKDTDSNPFPNPSKSVISLPYKLKSGESSVMRILNINGVVIEIKKIDSTFDKIQLNVFNYPHGTYIYEVNGESNRFIVN